MSPPSHSEPQAKNLSALLHRLSAEHGERAAVVGEHGTLSFAALDRATDAWAAAFAAAGCGRGAHIGLLAGNSPDWLAVAFGVWRAGATLVPISTFVTARELETILDHADVDLLVVQPQLRSHDYLAMLRSLPPLPRLRAVLRIDEARATHASPLQGEIDSESVACILYTSGTTGQPKGVMLSHRALLATVLPTAERTGLTRDDALLSTLPLFWVAGLAIRALPTLATGCALIVMETYTVDGLIAALQQHRPSALHLRPPQVGQLLAHGDCAPSLLSQVRRGGGRVEWFAGHLAADARFITGYGMTEMAGYVTALSWQDAAAERQTQLGAALPGVELRIIGGQSSSDDAAGEIAVRGPGLFSGYYKQPAGTGLDPDGWFLTGDLGRIDGNGTLHFIGRSKDLLRVKGINVSPVEVENVLSAHPAVEAVYVVGLPIDGLEHDVVAMIVSKPGAAASETDLRALAREALSHYKWPERYLFIERSDVPLGGTSKPQRAALAALAAGRIAKRVVPLKAKRGAVPIVASPDVARRRSIRLANYDYTQTGVYFITICAHERRHWFGEILDGQTGLSAYGVVVEECWDAIPQHAHHVELDAFVVMPNHVHGIFAISGVGATHASPSWPDPAPHRRATHASPLHRKASGPISRSVGAIVGSFKAAVTKRINATRTTPRALVWQHNYYEHVIRTDDELNRIRDYIATNSQRWSLDPENPQRVGEDEFDRWLATLTSRESPA
ncbi:MAG: AMP-binding protein [Deltaproteobacteria bacterium]|nr:AMP-binding protein [Deltaproteobacteria bacterium]MBI3388002.1 AMP-binding protein [Deltaproteobacteria bacterium]